MTITIPHLIFLLLAGSLIADPAYTSASLAHSHRPALTQEDSRARLFTEHAVVPAVLYVRDAYSRTTFRQVMQTVSLRRTAFATAAVIVLLLPIMNFWSPFIPEVQAVPSVMRPINPNFTATFTPQTEGRFVAHFSPEESEIILRQTGIRLTLQSLDKRPIWHAAIWVRSQKGRTLKMLSAGRIDENWESEPAGVAAAVASSSMQNVFIDLPIHHVNRSLQIINDTEIAPEKGLGGLAIAIQDPATSADDLSSSRKAKVTFEAFTDGDRMGAAPGGIDPGPQNPLQVLRTSA